jgi:signal transduction histidine kinase
VRTTVFAALVVTLALVAGAVLLLVVQRRALVAGVERNARNRADDVGALVRRRTLPTRLTAANEDAAFTEVVSADGRVLAASKNVEEQGPVVRTRPRGTHTVLLTRTIPALDDQQFRVAAVRVDTSSGPVYVYAGDRLEQVDDATEHLALVLALGVPLFAGLVALVTWRVTGRALRPVEAIRTEVSEIGEHDLHRRVPEPDTHDEIGRLARTMNLMLARLDEAAERQRRFVSDASHELQSPLTSLRARLEVDLASPSEPDWRSNEQEALDEVTEMQQLVDDLLTLARIEGPVDTVAGVPVDLDDVLLREAERVRTRSGLELDLHGVSAGQVVGDADQLRRAVRNVLENAERYAATRISASVTETDDTVELWIEDDGPGIPAALREQVFERFARIDDARSRDGSRTGLGLAITRAIVTAHGGRITVEDAPGARFVMRFPAATRR